MSCWRLSQWLLAAMQKCLLLQKKKEEHCCVIAFFCFGYDFGKGLFLYLDDLSVKELYHGRGDAHLSCQPIVSVALGSYGRPWTGIRQHWPYTTWSVRRSWMGFWRLDSVARHWRHLWITVQDLLSDIQSAVQIHVFCCSKITVAGSI